MKELGYEVISNTFAYKPNLLAGLVDAERSGKHLRLGKRKVRRCPRGCDQDDSYQPESMYAKPGYHVLRIVVVLALGAWVIPQQADVVLAIQIPSLSEKIVVTMPT